MERIGVQDGVETDETMHHKRRQVLPSHVPRLSAYIKEQVIQIDVSQSGDAR